MTLILDRIENGVAIVELPGGAWWRVSASLLPQGTEEGDALALEGSVITRDPALTQALRDAARAQLQRLSGV